MSRTVNICLMGDSLTEGDGNGSAYRYDLFELLYRTGADFRFVGASPSGDKRLPERYARHSGYCGYVIGDDDGKPEGSLRARLLEEPTREAVRQADILLLLIGANDYGQKLDLEHICERYDRLLDTLFALNPRLTVYAGVDFLRHEHNRALNDHILSLDTAALQAAGRDVRVVDLAAPEFRMNRGECDFPVDDGHPRPGANRKLAYIWLRAILPQVQKLNALSGKSLPVVPASGIDGDLQDTVLRPGESRSFHARVLPVEATVHTVLWNTTYPTVATVDSTGLVTAHRAGTTCLTAASLDGLHTASVLLFVQGTPVQPTEGLQLVYENNFSDESTWQGTTDNVVKCRYHEFHSYFRNRNGQMHSCETIPAGNRVWMEFAYMTANEKRYADETDRNFIEVSFGQLGVRLGGGSAYAYFTEDGQVLGTFRDTPRTSVQVSYAAEWREHTASLYRNGEKVLTVPTAGVPSDGRVGINWTELDGQNHLFDIRVYTD